MAKVVKRKNESIDRLLDRFNKQVDKEGISKVHQRLYKNDRSTSEAKEQTKLYNSIR